MALKIANIDINKGYLGDLELSVAYLGAIEASFIKSDFIISVKTDNTGSSLDNQYTIPMVNSVPYDIKTSDGQTINNVINNYTITFPTPGTYEVKLSPSSIDGSISLDNNYAADKYKLINVLNWGVNNIANLNGLFNGSGVIAISATDIPVLNNPNGGVNLHQVFGTTRYLLDVPNLELWDTSDVSSFRSSFYNSELFSNENENTLDLSNWDTSNVNDFSYMFYMGNGKGKVDFNMGAWNIENMTQAISFYAGFNAQPISIENYNSTLVSWAAQNVNSNISISFASSQYSYEAAAARNTLINTYGWTITDGGQTVSPEFVISVKTDNPGTSADNEFTLPWIGTYDIDWGDGVVETGLVDRQTHTYPSAGTYDVKVTATTGRIRFRSSPDYLKLLDIKNWGTCAWTSMDSAFWGCRSLTIVSATDYPVFNGNVNVQHMFRECQNMTYIDVSNWQMNGISSIYTLFFICYKLQTVKGLENWDVSSVTNIRNAFGYCNELLKLDVDVWDINQVGDFRDFASSANLPLSNYNKILISWAAQSPQINKSISFGNSQYSYEAAAARQTLIDDYGWTITDGGQVASPEFVISVKTDNAGTSNDDQFTLPWIGTYDIDWGDGNTDTGVVDTQTHTYASAGTYDIAVTANTGRIVFNGGGDKSKLLNIKNWGTIGWTTFERSFFGCINLTEITATDIPDFSQFIANGSIRIMFRDTRLSSINVTNWDVSNIADFENAFSSMPNLIEIIGLETWIISRPHNPNGFKAMFQGSQLINPNIENWNMPLNARLNYMLASCNAFDRDLSGWNIENVYYFSNFMNSSNGLSISNYDNTLVGWEARLQAIYPNGAGYPYNINTNFGNSQYTLGGAAEAARNTLINTFGWTITDGGGV